MQQKCNRASLVQKPFSAPRTLGVYLLPHSSHDASCTIEAKKVADRLVFLRHGSNHLLTHDPCHNSTDRNKFRGRNANERPIQIESRRGHQFTSLNSTLHRLKQMETYCSSFGERYSSSNPLTRNCFLAYWIKSTSSALEIAVTPF